ncbi:hypothetical protein MAR_024632 [Mya arenaria]|uniref:Uncharacterized protein n=1 Tax=Mya arenaria TaxID=6604 RepID=A0ABY7DRD2_MYAAR|nr:hypothetical protein MAR_024632 [Mya arenaria]
MVDHCCTQFPGQIILLLVPHLVYTLITTLKIFSKRVFDSYMQCPSINDTTRLRRYNEIFGNQNLGGLVNHEITKQGMQVRSLLRPLLNVVSKESHISFEKTRTNMHFFKVYMRSEIRQNRPSLSTIWAFKNTLENETIHRESDKDVGQQGTIVMYLEGDPCLSLDKFSRFQILTVKESHLCKFKHYLQHHMQHLLTRLFSDPDMDWNYYVKHGDSNGNKYTPVKSALPPASDNLLNVIHCNCKNHCDNKKCMARNMVWTVLIVDYVVVLAQFSNSS